MFQGTRQGPPGCGVGSRWEELQSCCKGCGSGRVKNGGPFVMRPTHRWREVSGTITRCIAVARAPSSPRSLDTSHCTHRGATYRSRGAGASPHHALPRRCPATGSRAGRVDRMGPRQQEGRWGRGLPLAGKSENLQRSGAVLGSVWGLAGHRKTTRADTDEECRADRVLREGGQGGAGRRAGWGSSGLGVRAGFSEEGHRNQV